MTITITAVNAVPTANADTASALEDSSVMIDLLSNDSKGPANEASQTLTVIAASALHGLVTINGDSTLTYTPNGNYNGSDTITYTIKDNGTTNGSPDPLTATGTVSGTVLNSVDISGRVFDDRDNDGNYDSGDGDSGLAGILMQLTDESDNVVASSGNGLHRWPGSPWADPGATTHGDP